MSGMIIGVLRVTLEKFASHLDAAADALEREASYGETVFGERRVPEGRVAQSRAVAETLRTVAAAARGAMP